MALALFAMVACLRMLTIIPCEEWTVSQTWRIETASCINVASSRLVKDVNSPVNTANTGSKVGSGQPKSPGAFSSPEPRGSWSADDHARNRL